MRARLLIVVCLLAAATAAADQTVTVGPGMVFTQSEVTVAPGDTVTWVWAPLSLPHSTTSDSQVGPEVWNSGIATAGSFLHT
ncbi:MAG: cupredoxin domain-containing protein, partial [Thermoanaerobaculia bacterium]